jgi:hypothetical protein
MRRFGDVEGDYGSCEQSSERMELAGTRAGVAERAPAPFACAIA